MQVFGGLFLWDFCFFNTIFLPIENLFGLGYFLSYHTGLHVVFLARNGSLPELPVYLFNPSFAQSVAFVDESHDLLEDVLVIFHIQFILSVGFTAPFSSRSSCERVIVWVDFIFENSGFIALPSSNHLVYIS